MRIAKMSTLSLLAATAVAVAVPAAASAAPNPADTPNEAMARAYIDALVSHDASDVVFTPDATRIEAGIQTGFSGEQLTNDLNNGIQYRVIQGVRDLEMTESGDTVHTTYLLDAGIGSMTLMTVEIEETFEMEDGAIDHIVATISPVSSVSSVSLS
ncbi:hypothetical protein [Rhodococcus xishaensis]|uniref:DUF8021 domain-containing protein n=1 Tax=Rhodococcus xishaensis TaxID=2487364 RepID=A0A438AT47_9NOCA|nr:hypothetical protein [Rhodococcus xishaensis]RVW01904.1 hypothetical protein EGT50_10565 [Rhodococcus xishaensis]